MGHFVADYASLSVVSVRNAQQVKLYLKKGIPGERKTDHIFLAEMVSSDTVRNSALHKVGTF